MCQIWLWLPAVCAGTGPARVQKLHGAPCLSRPGQPPAHLEGRAVLTVRYCRVEPRARVTRRHVWDQSWPLLGALQHSYLCVPVPLAQRCLRCFTPRAQSPLRSAVRRGGGGGECSTAWMQRWPAQAGARSATVSLLFSAFISYNTQSGPLLSSAYNSIQSVPITTF